MDDNNYKKRLKDAMGKKLLEETYLNYAKMILQELHDDPDMIYDVTSILEMQEETFIDKIENTEPDIVFYDKTLTLIIERHRPKR